MEKLRKEFMKERELAADAMKHVVIERRSTPVPPRPPPPKMVIDPQKLEASIKKACVPVPRRTIQVIDKPPVRKEEVTKAKPVVVALCKAMNLNGTPCKCRAKVGKFCAKHAL